MIRPFIIFALLSIITQHSFPVQAEDSPRAPTLNDLIFPVAANNAKKENLSSFQVIRSYLETSLKRGYAYCEDNRVCSKGCVWTKGESKYDPATDSVFCESGRCGLNGDGKPICGLGSPSDCADEISCTPHCGDPGWDRTFNKEQKKSLSFSAAREYDRQVRDAIHDLNLGKFCQSGKCSYKDSAAVCGCCDDDFHFCDDEQVCFPSCRSWQAYNESISESDKEYYKYRTETMNDDQKKEHLKVHGETYCKTGKCYFRDGWIETCGVPGTGSRQRQHAINIAIILLIPLVPKILNY